MSTRAIRRLEVALFLGIVALTGVLFVLFHSTSTSFDEELARSADFDATTWQEYRSVDYDVSLRYPERWDLVVSTDALNPYIRVTAPGEKTDAVNESITSTRAQVSIFPKGLPSTFQSELPATYSLFEQAVRSQMRRHTSFALDDGTRFAELYRYASTPETWSPSGFVWAQTDVSGVASACETDSVVVSEGDRRCDLLFGDRIVYTGRVRDYDMELVDAIVESVRFFGSVQSELGSSTAAAVSTPLRDAYVRNPLQIRGVAPSTWFFEGEIPIRLLDANNVVLVESSASAEDGLTSSGDTVTFSATIQFQQPDTRGGTLIVEKANPSGASQLSDQIRIPVLF